MTWAPHAVRRLFGGSEDPSIATSRGGTPPAKQSGFNFINVNRRLLVAFEMFVHYVVFECLASLMNPENAIGPRVDGWTYVVVCVFLGWNILTQMNLEQTFGQGDRQASSASDHGSSSDASSTSDDPPGQGEVDVVADDHQGLPDVVSDAENVDSEERQQDHDLSESYDDCDVSLTHATPHGDQMIQDRLVVSVNPESNMFSDVSTQTIEDASQSNSESSISESVTSGLSEDGVSNPDESVVSNLDAKYNIMVSNTNKALSTATTSLKSCTGYFQILSALKDGLLPVARSFKEFIVNSDADSSFVEVSQQPQGSDLKNENHMIIQASDREKFGSGYKQLTESFQSALIQAQNSRTDEMAKELQYVAAELDSIFRLVVDPVHSKFSPLQDVIKKVEQDTNRDDPKWWASMLIGVGVVLLVFCVLFVICVYCRCGDESDSPPSISKATDQQKHLLKSQETIYHGAILDGYESESEIGVIKATEEPARRVILSTNTQPSARSGFYSRAQRALKESREAQRQKAEDLRTNPIETLETPEPRDLTGVIPSYVKYTAMPGATPKWKEVPCSEQDKNERQPRLDEHGNTIAPQPPPESTKLVPEPAVKEGMPKPVLLDPESKHHDVIVDATIVQKAYYPYNFSSDDDSASEISHHEGPRDDTHYGFSTQDSKQDFYNFKPYYNLP